MSLPDHTPLRAPLAAIPRDLVSVADYARYAPGFIAPPVLEYIAGGGADEVTLKRNRQKLDELMILPRPLVDCTRGGTHTTVLGEHLRHPLLLAPVASLTSTAVSSGCQSLTRFCSHELRDSTN